MKPPSGNGGQPPRQRPMTGQQQQRYADMMRRQAGGAGPMRQAMVDRGIGMMGASRPNPASMGAPGRGMPQDMQASQGIQGPQVQKLQQLQQQKAQGMPAEARAGLMSGLTGGAQPQGGQRPTGPAGGPIPQPTGAAAPTSSMRPRSRPTGK
jgi:hypothetical protein